MPKYLCHFLAPRYVRSISRGRCGSATCFTSLLLLWRGKPRQSVAEQQAAASSSCTRSYSVKTKLAERHSGHRWGGSCTVSRAARPAAVAAADTRRACPRELSPNKPSSLPPTYLSHGYTERVSKWCLQVLLERSCIIDTRSCEWLPARYIYLFNYFFYLFF